MNRFRQVPAAAAVAAAMIGVLGACAPAPESGQTGSSTELSSSTQATSSATRSPQSGDAGVTDAQAEDLCTRLEAQLSPWRTYTPSVGRGGLNILIGEWAGANGVDLLALAGDRARIDTITSEQCPEVRQEAITALEIPDLASGLVGF
ncbi:hypothetical protein [Rhodococcus sp. (in: high G+C Gram-positive bacteria)]|uniref:hypothetical protein n=1 Tax=Rhodococcus sp. TaxID=1831 RepID=UPI001A06D763|nr:hypothetical protein [Rhodococcus sp. (in: high G+C Gram-positive bacteria)]MBF0660909.1 hypothetical protein [Rhodococcus sp. (in: high G+C Gram-positive bacteria)]